MIERVVAFTTGSSVTDADIRGWLHKPVTHHQTVLTELPEDGLDLEGLINTIEKDPLLKAPRTESVVDRRRAPPAIEYPVVPVPSRKYEIKGGRD